MDKLTLVGYKPYNYMNKQIITNHAVENSAHMVMCVQHKNTQLLSFIGYIVKFEIHICLRDKSTLLLLLYERRNITIQAVENSTLRVWRCV